MPKCNTGFPGNANLLIGSARRADRTEGVSSAKGRFPSGFAERANPEIGVPGKSFAALSRLPRLPGFYPEAYDALRGADAEKLLTSYEQERRGAVTANVERYTDLLTRGVLLSGPLLRRVLGSVVPKLLGCEVVIRRLGPRMGMLDTHYRASVLLHGGGAHLGRRAPDGEVQLPDGRRMVFSRRINCPDSAGRLCRLGVDQSRTRETTGCGVLQALGWCQRSDRGGRQADFPVDLGG